MADDTEAAAEDGVRRQTKIHDIKYIKKLRAKLDHAQLAAASSSKGSVLDHGHVKIVKSGPAEGVAAKGAEAPLIWAGSPGHVGRNKKERAIVHASAKIILTNCAARRKIRHGYQIRPVRSTGPCPCLLNSGINRKRRARR